MAGGWQAAAQPHTCLVAAADACEVGACGMQGTAASSTCLTMLHLSATCFTAIASTNGCTAYLWQYCAQQGEWRQETGALPASWRRPLTAPNTASSLVCGHVQPGFVVETEVRGRVQTWPVNAGNGRAGDMQQSKSVVKLTVGGTRDRATCQLSSAGKHFPVSSALK
jgi:hypothetical protein